MIDTSAKAAEIQARIHRQLSGSARLQMALDMSAAARALARARIAGAHPEWDERRVTHELLRLTVTGSPAPPR